MDNKEMEKTKLDTEELEPIAGGSNNDIPIVSKSDVDYESLTCPHCGGKYVMRTHSFTSTDDELDGWDYYTVRCEDCGHEFSYGHNAPDVGVIKRYY